MCVSAVTDSASRNFVSKWHTTKIFRPTVLEKLAQSSGGPDSCSNLCPLQICDVLVQFDVSREQLGDFSSSVTSQCPGLEYPGLQER